MLKFACTQENSINILKLILRAHHQWKWSRLSFGVNTAGGIFVLALSQVFGSEFKQFLTIYIDDLFVVSKNFNDHIMHLTRKEISFLGFILGTKGVDIQDIPETKSRLELQTLSRFVSTIGAFNHNTQICLMPFDRFSVLNRNSSRPGIFLG